LDVFDSCAIDLEVGPSGEVEIGLGQQRVEGIGQLGEDPRRTGVRDLFATPIAIGRTRSRQISRSSASAPLITPPPLTAAAVCERLDGLISFMRAGLLVRCARIWTTIIERQMVTNTPLRAGTPPASTGSLVRLADALCVEVGL
jgi:hypothetical protein